MKTTYKFIIALFTATLALSSCTKDIVAEKEDVNPQDGLRTIAISFDSSTKSYLDNDGVTPIFEEGDEIAVSNNKEEQRVSVRMNEKGDLCFTTTLQGELVAIYPSSKASFEAGKPTFKIPVEQRGLFKDSNIAMAKIGEDDNYATFVNQTAVLKFYIGPEIGVQRIIISSNSQLVTENSKIVVEVAKLRESKVIDPQERICYVAVLPGVSQMKVESFTSTQKVENLEGCVTREFRSVNLSRNTLANVFIPYYIPVNVGSESEPEYQYWGYCNLGAFLPEEPGYYFSWGNTEGHWLNAKSDGYQFTADVYNNTQGGKITESRLAPESDAAYVAWGGKWRMPTKAESMILKEQVSADYKYEKNGYSFGNLFLPAAGHIADYQGSMTQWNEESASEFWTSDGYSDQEHAYYFIKYEFDYYTNLRYQGIPIRPIYAPTPGSTEDDIPDGALKGVFTVSDGGTPGNTSDDIMVRFSQGNLRYTVNTKKWSFYEHQYDCATGYDANLISLFTWGYNESTSTVPDGKNYVTGHTEDGDSFSASEDWGSQIGDGKTWRTLTTAEWQYLFNTRATSTNTGTENARYAKATVGSISGIILLPDKYEHPSGVAELKKLNPRNDTESDINTEAAFTENTYSVADWEKMEAAGAVFLPSAGYREGSDVDFDNNYGAYWSSTAFDEEWAYYVDFASPLYHTAEDFYFIPDDADDRAYGCSVRLVANVSAAPATGSTVDDFKVLADDSSNWQ